MAPSQETEKLVRGTQSALGILPRILTGTMPHRTILEDHQTRHSKRILQKQETLQKSRKTRIKTKKINQNVPLF